MRFVCLLAAILHLLSPVFSSASKGSKHAFPPRFFHSFVTQPDIKAPKWRVKRHAPELESPGYFFLAPYTDNLELNGFRATLPCYAGPHIYDRNGDLVWSGACIERRRNTYDFRVATVRNRTLLSFIHGPTPACQDYHTGGYAVMMDDTYTIHDRILTLNDSGHFNVHEFYLTPDGQKALFFSSLEHNTNIFGDEPAPKNKAGVALNGHFRDDRVVEMDVASRNIDFQWSPHGHGVSARESYYTNFSTVRDPDKTWDYTHANSIALTDNHDYIVSARHLSTIYRVNGRTGDIVWRLGGRMSDFVQDFNFSNQHDARVLTESGTSMTLSLLDNASGIEDQVNATARMSTAKVVVLNTNGMTATLLHEWERPDAGLSHKRGNFQALDNGNSVVCWSEAGYTTEHDKDGRLLFEGRFLAPQFDTYRGYKAPFVGRPADPPLLKSFLADARITRRDITSYVSWNGATEVVAWRLHGAVDGRWQEIQTVPKHGFETTISSYGEWTRLFVEGLDKANNSLGRSVEEFVAPGRDNQEKTTSPDDREGTKPDRLRIAHKHHKHNQVPSRVHKMDHLGAIHLAAIVCVLILSMRAMLLIGPYVQSRIREALGAQDGHVRLE
ncbi:hypothetical protein ANO11243_061430 [Dothideomycetidae sp. 11243]|nr:hypothetical protein ANO11243_061430 [fungal sp. No.11243]